MKFLIGEVPASETLETRPGWTRVTSLPTGLLFLYSAPVGILLFLLVGLYWNFIFESPTIIPRIPSDLPFPIILLLTIATHELVHAATLPGFPFSPCCIMGFWPSRFAPFVTFDGVLTRRRAIFFTLGPLFLLTVVPILLSFAAGLNHRLVAAVSILNACGSCADIFLALILLKQVPGEALVCYSRTETFWSRPQERLR